jgi:hypothetical protein
MPLNGAKSLIVEPVGGVVSLEQMLGCRNTGELSP